MRLPLAPWLAGYRREWLGADVVAGLTTAAIVVPKAMAYGVIEYTALVMLTEAEESLRARGVSLWLAALNPDALRTIERSSLGATLGRERMQFDLHHALAAWRRSVRGSDVSNV